MAPFKVSIVLLAVVACSHAWGSGRQQQQGYDEMGSMGQMSRGLGGGRGSRQALDQGMQGMSQMGGRGARQFGGEEDARKYNARLINDDDVYGYEAKIPAADILYVNYRNSDARARRGQEFARNFRGGDLGEGNERSSRMGQNGNGRSQRMSSNGMGMGMGMGMNMQRQQSQW